MAVDTGPPGRVVGHPDEQKHLAPSTICSYQGTVRLFTDLLIDTRYGLGPVCEVAFGTFPVAICHEWNTLPHLQD
ncbi:hypothetical protein [Streptomyces sp. NPDC048295]|uniref:hypothetical protein n=1 Tax=Streptomyces sp. NPDC048295 TaxID=3154617 RepID=UPI003438DFB9